jgi:Rieske Fe-S protein
MANLSRQSFLRRSLLLGAGACTLATLPGCFLFDEPELLVGTLDELAQAGHLVRTFNRKQILVTRLEGELVIFSLICRHKKCTVKYQAFEQEFHCPCHEGVYDRFGRVIDGPPPGPLHRYAYEVREAEIWVLNQPA